MNDGTVTVKLTKAHIEVIAPGLEMLAESYRERVKYGTSRFAYPFRIYPPPRGFERGTFDQVIMEKILSLAGLLKTERTRGRGIEMDTV